MPGDQYKSPKSLPSNNDSSKKTGCCGCRRKKEKSSGSRRTPTKMKGAREGVAAGTTGSLEVAADLLPVRSRREREQVTKALEEEMARRREWRTAARNRRTSATFATGPPGRAGAILPLLVDEEPDKEFAPEMTPGEQAYFTTPEVMAGLEKSVCLDDQRREWIKKMQSQAGAGGKSPKSPQARLRQSSAESQPETLTLDDASAKELGSHTLTNMLKRVLVQAKLMEASEKSRKAPTDMSPEELIEFRRRDPQAYDTFVTANSVTSFALSKPTEEDQTRAKKLQAKYKPSDAGKGHGHGRRRGARRVHFENKVEIVEAPIGEDFQLGEKTRYGVAPLQKR